MPIITVDMWEGRSVDQKRKLVRELTDAFVRTCGSEPEGIYVVVRDVAKHNWAIGGELCCDRAASTADAETA
jgi:4-oxalocrotonate tautomerase